MKWRGLIVLGAVFIVGAIVSFLFFYFLQGTMTTGDAICTTEYSFTKAICNDTNFCQDYEITCSGQDLVAMEPLTGAVVQYPEDWNDPRTNEEIYKTCD